MAFGGVTYSGVVRGLRIVLPLAALALLSTLFLLADKHSGDGNLPFAQVDIEKTAREGGIGSARFSGVMEGGELIRLTAGSAQPDPNNSKVITASNIDARIIVTPERTVSITATGAVIDNTTRKVTLNQGVLIETTDGYRMETDEIVTGMDALSAESTGEVTGNGPIGVLQAGKMRISGGDKDNNGYLFSQTA